jgi:hypothetical protein
MDTSDLKKLKVAELRDELAKRGLEQKGVKDELVQRLFEAISADAAATDDVVEAPAGDAAEEPVAAAAEVTTCTIAGAAASPAPAFPQSLLHGLHLC